MNPIALEFVNDIISTEAPSGNKDCVTKYAVEKYELTKDRSVYYCDAFAVRFSYSRNNSFSNTVASLSRLKKYDRIPFFAVLVKREGPNLIYLSNSTFIDKISHSSRELTIDRIRGSFNGSNILKKYDSLDNVPKNFEELFATHSGMEWLDNLERLVDASSNITPHSQKFTPTKTQRDTIYDSVNRAVSFINSSSYETLSNDLDERCKKSEKAIQCASKIKNVNIRGRLIEALVAATEEERQQILKDLSLWEKKENNLPNYNTKNGLGDYVRLFNNGITYTDIKTKVIFLDSNPKAFNIDKFLEIMSEKDSIFLFFFIGINEIGHLSTRLCSVYTKSLLETSIAQHHWAGRATRGVMQFSGKTIDCILGGFRNAKEIDRDYSINFLDKLLNR